jgi:high affinity sulfate transporter 1
MPPGTNQAGTSPNKVSRSPGWLPFVEQIAGYKRDWLKSDIAAGLSVAAVSLPTAIAYPAIAGLPIETGLFATVFSLIGYALLGPSRQLMVGPDTATCIMLAGVLAAVGAAGEADRVTLTLALTLMVGLLCFAGGLLRLGFLANFLSRPMLVGFLAGISLSLIIGQIERLTSVDIQSDGLVRPAIELATRIDEVDALTLTIGLGTLVFLRVSRYAMPSLPATLVAIIVVTGISYFADFQSQQVAVIGPLPDVAFDLHLPQLDQVINLDLMAGALAIMLVGFGSGAVTARSFAMKARSSIDADRELFGFGAANLLSGLFGGFPVTASDSRTAVNFGVGGKTQLVAIVAAGALAIVVLYLADALFYLPTATLGAILVSAAIDLIDLSELRALLRISRSEFCFAMITMVAVVVVGVLQGIFIAIATTFAHLLWAASRPRLALMGRIPGSAGLHKLHRFPEAQRIPGLTIVVLQSALVFFNAEFVKHRLLRIAHATRGSDRWFILDAAAVNTLDSTGIAVLEEVRAYLARQNVDFGIADLNSRARLVMDRSGMARRIGHGMIFPSAEAAVAAFDALPAAHNPAAAPTPTHQNRP